MFLKNKFYCIEIEIYVVILYWCDFCRVSVVIVKFNYNDFMRLIKICCRNGFVRISFKKRKKKKVIFFIEKGMVMEFRLFLVFFFR